MAKIALVPMAAKPYHAGHDALVRWAAAENDHVYILTSAKDRENVKGTQMITVWQELIIPSLPSNCEVVFCKSPVGQAYSMLGDASTTGSTDDFSVYSDDVDAERFSPTKMKKYAPNINVRAANVNRTAFVDVSSTRIRKMIADNDKRSFLEHIPPTIDGDRYWEIISAESEI